MEKLGKIFDKIIVWIWACIRFVMYWFWHTVTYVPVGIYEWLMELFYIRVIEDGKIHYVKSGTKAVKSLVAIAAVLMLGLIITAFYYKIFGSSKYQKILTVAVLSAFLGLEAIITLLLGWLQSNYTNHKKASVDSFKAPINNGKLRKDHFFKNGKTKSLPPVSQKAA